MIIRARHIEASRFELESGEHRLVSDQLPEFGGEGLGPMPSELLLWAVAACFGQAVRFVARRMRKPLSGLKLEINGTKDRDNFRFASICIDVSADAPSEALEQIVQTARKYCYVTNSLSPQVHLEVKVRHSLDPSSTQLRNPGSPTRVPHP
jgi:uncharacterized OsmC-like protein